MANLALVNRHFCHILYRQFSLLKKQKIQKSEIIFVFLRIFFVFSKNNIDQNKIKTKQKSCQFLKKISTQKNKKKNVDPH